MINSSRHSAAAREQLAGSHTVIAPDLIGHGDSATPRGDYSIGAHAAAIRDLLAALGVREATIVGHSLGGGVAMQFWLVPRPGRAPGADLERRPRAEREPAAAGGGPPGASPALAIAARPRVVRAIAAVADGLERRGSDKAAPRQGLAPRRAFLQTLRGVIDARGQRVSAVDRLYLLGAVPSLIVWGERDRTIPIEHGRAAHEAIPHSRFETLPRAAHFPHLEDPDGLASVLLDFLATTEPYAIDADDWEELLGSRTVRRRRLRAA